MITIAICDDDRHAINSLRKSIQDIIRYSNFNDLTYRYVTASTPSELYEHAKNTSIDVLFLDIQLPGESGLEIAKEFQTLYQDTEIIFVSSFESYVFFSMRFRPFRFIRKSMLNEELPEAILSVLQHINHPSTSLLLNSSNKAEIVHIPKIIFIEKEKKSNYIVIHLQNKLFKERANLSDTENKLSKHGFCKINSGTIININHVVKLSASSVEMSDGSTLNVSPKYFHTLSKQLVYYFRQKEGI